MIAGLICVVDVVVAGVGENMGFVGFGLISLKQNCHNPNPSPKSESKVQFKSPSLNSKVKTLNSRTWTWSDSILLCHHHPN